MSLKRTYCLDHSESMLGSWGTNTSSPYWRYLSREMGDLDPGVSLNGVFFNHSPVKWRSTPVRIGEFREDFIKKVRGLKHVGGTDVVRGMESAFTDREIDTIILVTDTDNRQGRYATTGEILWRVRTLNYARMINIHTRSEAPSRFLRRLAGENGGEFHELPR